MTLDLTNHRCGRLKPLRPLPERRARSVVWECLCNPEWGGCGKTVNVAAAPLAAGATQSCGCLRDEMLRNNRHAKQRSERNASIYQRYQAGESIGLLSEAFDVKKQRIQQIVKAEATWRGETPRPPWQTTSRKPVPLKPISQELLDSYTRGAVTLKEAAAAAGVCETTFLKRRRAVMGGNLHDNRSEAAQRKNAEVYRKFMAGATMCELAEEYHTSIGCVSQWVLHHRRRTGAPAKRPHNSPNRNGSSQ